MGEFLWFFCVLLWLVLSGWAFQGLAKGADHRIVLALFIMCLALGPFLAGFVLGERLSRDPTHD